MCILHKIECLLPIIGYIYQLFHATEAFDVRQLYLQCSNVVWLVVDDEDTLGQLVWVGVLFGHWQEVLIVLVVVGFSSRMFVFDLIGLIFDASG